MYSDESNGVGYMPVPMRASSQLPFGELTLGEAGGVLHTLTPREQDAVMTQFRKRFQVRSNISTASHFTFLPYPLFLIPPLPAPDLNYFIFYIVL